MGSNTGEMKLGNTTKTGIFLAKYYREMFLGNTNGECYWGILSGNATGGNTTGDYYCVVCVFSSHSFWASSSLDVPVGVTQEEGHTGFLIHLLSAVRALIFLARRIQPFLSLVDCEVDFFLCVLTI